MNKNNNKNVNKALRSGYNASSIKNLISQYEARVKAAKNKAKHANKVLRSGISASSRKNLIKKVQNKINKKK